jgi:hypothetical protein
MGLIVHGEDTTDIHHFKGDLGADSEVFTHEKFILYGDHGSNLSIIEVEKEVELDGATSTTSGLILAGDILLGISTIITATITGATGYNAGDGTDADRWAAKASTTAIGSGSGAKDYVGTKPPVYCTSDQEVVLTALGSNFTGGKIRVSAKIIRLTDLTS